MNYTARPTFDHDTSASESFGKMGILLTNLGTPDAPDAASLRRYLKEFLSDPRVVEQPRWLWWPVLNLVILNVRPTRSAASYRSVWTEQGSPLMVHSLEQQSGLQALMGDDVHVELAMRYGNPSIASGLQTLRDKGCTKILVFPLYPQYSATTTGSTFDAVAAELMRWRRVPQLHMIDDYHDHPAYIAALVASVKKHWSEFGRADRLLMSFHGIPQRYFDAGDPYPCMCHKTARLLAEALELHADEWFVAFQSRFGREPWVAPYTDATLKEWGAAGVERVDVICPGFSADCLETLEEIAVENRGYFIEAGGKEMRYIPAMNGDDAHVRALAEIARTHVQGWME